MQRVLNASIMYTDRRCAIILLDSYAALFIITLEVLIRERNKEDDK